MFIRLTNGDVHETNYAKVEYNENGIQLVYTHNNEDQYIDIELIGDIQDNDPNA